MENARAIGNAHSGDWFPQKGTLIASIDVDPSDWSLACLVYSLTQNKMWSFVHFSFFLFWKMSVPSTSLGFRWISACHCKYWLQNVNYNKIILDLIWNQVGIAWIKLIMRVWHFNDFFKRETFLYVFCERQCGKFAQCFSFLKVKISRVQFSLRPVCLGSLFSEV